MVRDLHVGIALVEHGVVLPDSGQVFLGDDAEIYVEVCYLFDACDGYC